ncbi:hypothetical protein QQF64_014955 [Cirrhinus molitorella]|uniref:Uncharacterized protein n=1 Tax=Cirrhinus molitorella TaxID=172907 RepID=A0ABR3NTZ6_9TELE
MTREGVVFLCWFWILQMLHVTEGSTKECRCPSASILSHFPSEVPKDTCCLNYSGSTFNQVPWATFLSHTHLQVLDLTNCNISHIDHSDIGDAASSLRELYLSQNRLTSLPADFLTKAYSLEVLDLGENHLKHLPEQFLQSSDKLRALILERNQLSSLPHSVLKPSLEHLELVGNHWACTCSLTSLPADFLTKAYSLEVLDLGENHLKHLPEQFLQSSDKLRALILERNQLSSLPHSVLKPSLEHLELVGNHWACTCSLWEGLQIGLHDNSSNLHDLVGNLSCAAPHNLAGRSVWSLKNGDVCHLANLTALFILLPLFLLLSLVLCWCCGRKKKRKDSSSFSPTRKRSNNSYCNGRWPHAKLPAGDSAVAVDGGKEVILRNQLILQPSSNLLDSTRDIYEEVEIKLGSVDSLAPPPSTCSTEGTAGKQDLDTVSVSEVMKDSADREKAYLTQSTEYYSLVPGIEIEDSDHGEYENVDLS